jgi:transposase-like protein
MQIKAGAIQFAQKMNMISENPNTPTCPSCGCLVQLARITPRFGGLPELQTFICRPCGEVFTEAVVGPVAWPNANTAACWHTSVVDG